MRENILLRRTFLAVLAALASACESSNVVPLPAPPASDVAITGFSPASGFSGDLVQVRGAGFGSSVAGIEVLFNGYGARPESVDAAGTVLSVRVPAGVASGELTVTAPLGRATSGDKFEYLGGGHLTRGAVSRSVHLRAGLGALQLRGSDAWALATTLHQLVKVDGEMERVRLDALAAPVDVSPEPDAWGRTVIATGSQVIALPLGDAADAQRLAVDLPTTEIFRLVPLKGKAVLALAPHAAFIVALVPDDELPPRPDPLHDRIQEISPGDTGVARIIDGTADDDGFVYLAAEDAAQHPLVVVSGGGLVRPKLLVPPARLAGPIVRIVDVSGTFLAAATLDGRLAFAALSTGRFAPDTVDLLASGPAISLFADEASGTVYASVPASGRLVAVTRPQAPQLAWTVALGGKPRGMVRSGDRLFVANEATNAVQVVDLVQHALLGEKRVDLGAGSPLGGHNGIDIVHLAATDKDPAEDLAVVLSRAADALVGLDPTTESAREPAFLAPGARAFAASDEGFAIVAHDDGTLGRVAFGHLRAPAVEQVLCHDPLACAGSAAIALEIRGSEVLVVTPRLAQVRKADTLELLASRPAHDGGFYAGGRFTGSGVALLWSDKAAGAGTLAFLEASSTATLADTQPLQLEHAAAGLVLAPLGVTTSRASASDTGPVFLFLRNAALAPRPWAFAPARAEEPLVPVPALGAAPSFSPDGRQIAGLGISSDGLSASMLFVRGDFLAGEPLSPQSVADLPAVPTGFAYSTGGDRAVAVLGSTDTLLVFE